jgi:hypothetical protein
MAPVRRGYKVEVRVGLDGRVPEHVIRNKGVILGGDEECRFGNIGQVPLGSALCIIIGGVPESSIRSGIGVIEFP